MNENNLLYYLHPGFSFYQFESQYSGELCQLFFFFTCMKKFSYFIEQLPVEMS